MANVFVPPIHLLLVYHPVGLVYLFTCAMIGWIGCEMGFLRSKHLAWILPGCAFLCSGFFPEWVPFFYAAVFTALVGWATSSHLHEKWKSCLTFLQIIFLWFGSAACTFLALRFYYFG